MAGKPGAQLNEFLPETRYTDGIDQTSFFLATDLVKISDGGGVAGESIVVHEVPLAQAGAWLHQRAAEGLLVSAKVYAGLYFASAALS